MNVLLICTDTMRMYFSCKIFDFGGGVCHGVVQEVAYSFFTILIVSVDFSDAIDPIGSSIVESIARV